MITAFLNINFSLANIFLSFTTLIRAYLFCLFTHLSQYVENYTYMYMNKHLRTGTLWVDSDRGWPCASMYLYGTLTCLFTVVN